MAENIHLSLRASTKIDPTKDSLPFLIARINEERGSFRNITEESLEEEIREAENAQFDEAAAAEEDIQNVKSRQEELEEARQEMLAQVHHAWSESYSSLSMISLLLAGHNQESVTSRQAWDSLDPYLKERFQKDALGVDILETQQKTEAEKHNEQMVEIGWKIKAAQSVGDRLLDSSARLAKEMESETRYWDQVLRIKEQGWSVSRLPREKHALSVRYGFAEAHADFRDRGLAALRRDEDGNISLDRGVQFSGDRKLRVRVLQHGKAISCNRLSRSAYGDPDDAMEDDSIENEILQARDSLFDEELHAEIHREARHLTNQGVSCIGDIIQLPYDTDKFIQIDLIDVDELESGALHDDDTVPTAISIALRILLSHAHHDNLRRRSRPPPPLTESRTARPVYQILKPIIEHLRHRSALQSCHKLIASLTAALASAHLPLTLDPSATPPFNLPTDLSTPNTETLIRALISPLHSSLTLRLPSAHTTRTLTISTNLFAPAFGTTYQSTTTTSHSRSETPALYPQVLHFTSLADLRAHVAHFLTLDLVSCVCAAEQEWSIVDAHAGMLVREHGSLSARVGVEVEEGKVRLQWASEGEENGVRGEKIWDGDGGGGGEGEGLLEVMGRLV